MHCFSATGDRPPPPGGRQTYADGCTEGRRTEAAEGTQSGSSSTVRRMPKTQQELQVCSRCHSVVSLCVPLCLCVRFSLCPRGKQCRCASV
eukprot:COSAG03_NODE_12285_length_553_cov_12.530837_1_plen_90_part_10